MHLRIFKVKAKIQVWSCLISEVFLKFSKDIYFFKIHFNIITYAQFLVLNLAAISLWQANAALNLSP